MIFRIPIDQCLGIIVFISFSFYIMHLCEIWVFICRRFSVETDLGRAEQVWCGIKSGKYNILIGCVYISPDLNYETKSEISTTMKRAWNRVENWEYSSIIIFGDFNHPDINWTQEGVGTSDVVNEMLLIDSIDDSFLTQCVNFTT